VSIDFELCKNLKRFRD